MLELLALAPTPLSPPHPPAEIELTWQAPDECPTGDEVMERYQALLSSAPHGEGKMFADAEIVQDPPGTWRLELVTRMGEYTDVRKLDAPRCGDLGEAAAMLFAVALEPELGPTPAPTPPPEPTPEPEPTDEDEDEDGGTFVLVEVEDPPLPSATAPQRKPWLLSVGIGPDFGAVPGLTARAIVGAGYAWKSARLEGELVWYAPRNEASALGPASIQVAAAAVRGCGVPGTGNWKFPVCLGVEAGTILARVSRAGERRTVAGARVTPLLRASAVYQWKRLGAFAAVEGAGPVFGSQIRLDNERFFSPTTGSVRGVLGVELYFF